MRPTWENGLPSTDTATTRRASLFALFVFIPWLILLGLSLDHWHADIQLDRRARTTTGVITGIEHENHGQYDYNYIVDGNTYSGGEILSATVFLSTGAPVQVLYDPDDPKRSSLTPFGETGGRLIPILFFGGVSILIFFRVRKFLRGPADPYDQ